MKLESHLIESIEFYKRNVVFVSFWFVFVGSLILSRFNYGAAMKNDNKTVDLIVMVFTYLLCKAYLSEL